MLVTIKSSNKVWSSPDNKISIWDLIDGDGNKWQTRSNQIAEAIDQTLDLTTTVSKAGKTYLIKPPREGESEYGGSRLTQPAIGQLQAPSATERFEKAVAAFEVAVNKLVGDAPASPAERPTEDPEFNYDDILDDL